MRWNRSPTSNKNYVVSVPTAETPMHIDTHLKTQTVHTVATRTHEQPLLFPEVQEHSRRTRSQWWEHRG